MISERLLMTPFFSFLWFYFHFKLAPSFSCYYCILVLLRLNSFFFFFFLSCFDDQFSKNHPFDTWTTNYMAFMGEWNVSTTTLTFQMQRLSFNNLSWRTCFGQLRGLFDIIIKKIYVFKNRKKFFKNLKTKIQKIIKYCFQYFLKFL